MSTTQLPVIQGPGIHEMVDALKYALSTEEKLFNVIFRLDDPHGALTGYGQPVFNARIIGLKHTFSCGSTLLVTALLSLKDTKDTRTWRIDDDEYRYAPASVRSGQFNLRLLP